MREVEESKARGPESEVAARRTSGTPRVGAFFDMDKTLIAENSASLYMKYRYELGEVDNWDMAKGASAYLQYKLGVLDLQTWAKQEMRQFKGRKVAELEQQAREFFEDRVLPNLYPEAEALVREHQRSGHVVAIVSGATRFVVEPLARHLGIDDILFTRLEVEDDCFTGRVIEPICFEEGKIYWLQQFIDVHEIDLARSYFYTDSVTDLPLLDLVGHPVVTNPDPMLYRTARRRHWPVRFFEAPEFEAHPPLR